MPTKTTSQFIQDAIAIHGILYDYTKVIYEHSKKVVKIICPEHGIFEQRPNCHLNGQGCKKCGYNLSSKIRSFSINDFIEKANKIHNNFYSYSLSTYNGSHKKILIICPKHGQFNITVNHHLSGHGCSKCARNKQLTTEDFISKAINVHKDRYNYNLSEYHNSNTKIQIICKVHGVFEILPHNHFLGQGCKKCSNQFSKGEKEVLRYIKSIYNGLIIENDRTIIKPYELDIYLPDLKIGIEYNGRYWHNLREQNQPGYHQVKVDLCKQKRICLINISDIDWLKNNEIIKSILNNTIKNF